MDHVAADPTPAAIWLSLMLKRSQIRPGTVSNVTEDL
jgi:hypothetical protein